MIIGVSSYIANCYFSIFSKFLNKFYHILSTLFTQLWNWNANYISII